MSALPAVSSFITGTVIPGVRSFTEILRGIWGVVEGPLNSLKAGFESTFNFILNNVINPVVFAIQGISNAVQGALGSLGLLQSEKQLHQGNLPPEFYDSLNGYATGGYTGGGSPQSVAGVVHAQEYVIPRQGVPVIRESGGSQKSAAIQIDKVEIYANTREGGQAAADGFMRRMDEYKRRRG